MIRAIPTSVPWLLVQCVLALGHTALSNVMEISPECSFEGLMLKLKLQYLASWCEELIPWKRPWCRKDQRQEEEKGTPEDEMVGWYHRLDAHEFEQALGVGDDEQALMNLPAIHVKNCVAVHGLAKSRTQLSNWTELTFNRLWTINQDNSLPSTYGNLI